MYSWYILIGLWSVSGIMLFAMVYYKRWQFEKGKMNISFHHVPIFHLHEYSLFLNRISPHFSRRALLGYSAHAYVWVRFTVGRIKGKINQTNIAQRVYALIDQVRGRQYLMKSTGGSEFLRAIAEHKHRIRNGQ